MSAIDLEVKRDKLTIPAMFLGRGILLKCECGCKNDKYDLERRHMINRLRCKVHQLFATEDELGIYLRVPREIDRAVRRSS